MKIEASLDTLDSVVHHINNTLPLNCIVFLRGDLASGKTTLTQAIAKSKGVISEVTSPTFSIQQCYITHYGTNVYHYDLYRLEHEAFMNMGLFEEFEKKGWHMIEWGSKELKVFLESVGYNVITIDIEHYHEYRIYTIEA